MTGPRKILLLTDDYSPNSKPHALAALHWSSLFAPLLKSVGPDGVEDGLRAIGWDPQWRFSMYSQAHYHSTTHELLVVIESSATVQLGGTDERAKPKNVAIPSESCTSLKLEFGDVLLLPAGYSHRLLQSEPNFTMIGSYPSGSTRWDMRFPNVMGCPHDVKKIEAMVDSSPRKGLHAARSPEQAIQPETSGQGEMEKEWQL